MTYELYTQGPTDLAACLRLTDDQLFTTDVLAHALELLEHEAGHLVANVETVDGRREINKTSRAVGGAIKRLDERRRAYVAELKARPKQIDDMFRETFRRPAEAMQERIRRPLDQWNEEQRAAEEETDRLIGELSAPVEAGTNTSEIMRRLDAAQSMNLPDWVSENQREAIAAAMQAAIPRLQAAHDAAVRAEEQAAELDRLRAEQAAQAAVERARREEQEHAKAAVRQAEEAQRIAEQRQREAEERTSQAEAQERAKLAAEQQAKADEEKRRATDKAHLEAIHAEIVADLEMIGVNAYQALDITLAIARGQIPHLRIIY